MNVFDDFTTVQKDWSIEFIGNVGTSRHPSLRRQTVEVLEKCLHVKQAVYESSMENGKVVNQNALLQSLKNIIYHYHINSL